MKALRDASRLNSSMGPQTHDTPPIETRMIHRRGRALMLSLAALAPAIALLLTGCAWSRPSEDYDRQLGEEASKQVVATLGLVTEPHLTGYVDALGQRLAANVPERRFTYRFAVLDYDEPNAFALPGGYVYVSRGLLALANSESELANVIGHEIVHVTQRHAVRRQSAGVLPGLLNLPGNLVGVVIDENLGRLLGAPLRDVGALYLARYSREQEREADRLGQQLCADAGFHPGAMGTYLRRIEAEQSLRVDGAARAPRFFETHPSTPQRAADADARARELVWSPQPGIAVDVGDFLHKLDGLVIGHNPAQGVFHEALFLYPDMGFALTMPGDWKTFNTAQAVGAVAPREDGLFYMEQPTPGTDPAQAAEAYLRELARQARFQVTRAESYTVAGLPAHRVSLVMPTRSGPMYLEATWVAHDKLLYRMLGLTLSDAYRDTLRAAADSFHPITDAERSSVQVTRLRLVKAQREESLAQLGERVKNQWSPAQTAVMNGLNNSPLVPGQFVKVALLEPYEPSR